ncbi:hypothetical protein [Mesorhizobium silamurunense]|uniref:hypothetical protein n=1 Tax=Mesorhizobium silamurunense TaxID=499528 RepID=UPI0017814B48|nr:hypothetical protein [Mesorhizobium silamurunense]
MEKRRRIWRLMTRDTAILTVGKDLERAGERGIVAGIYGGGETRDIWLPMIVSIAGKILLLHRR